MHVFKPHPRLALLCAALCCVTVIEAQTPPAPLAKSTSARHRARTAAHATVPPEPTLAPPPPPNWPINDAPGPPSIEWNATGLSIEASNSSLKQILDAVASVTGTRVEGFTQDQRVFGNFGPGQPRDVLSQLLHGSGYNIVMIGNQATGAPRELVLSSRKIGGGAAPQPGARPAQDDSDDDSYDNPVEVMPPAPPQEEPARIAPDAGRSPQQIQQELQQRQQQLLIQQNQQQQTTNPPPN